MRSCKYHDWISKSKDKVATLNMTNASWVDGSKKIKDAIGVEESERTVQALRRFSLSSLAVASIINSIPQ